MIKGTRMMMKRGGGAPLPYDAEVEYLESYNGAYIDTGISFLSTYTVEVDAAFLSAGGGTGVMIGCASGDYGSLRFRSNTLCDTFVMPTSIYDSIIGSINGNWLNLTIDTMARHVYNMSETFSLDGSLVAGCGNFRRGGTILISRGSNASRWGSCRYYGFSISDGEGYKMQLQPVRVGSGANATGYMYDRVSRKLFRNAGTGAFTIGPDK